MELAATGSAFTLDKERQCRARGHVFSRNFRHSTGKFEPQVSNNCFRCGQVKLTLVGDTPATNNS